MISRQRDNLRRTFASRELKDNSAANAKRLTVNQNEILDATTELADGTSAFGDVQPLFDAAEVMKEAIAALQQSDLATATESEQEALAALVQARKNIRKILKQSNSSSSSQCRSFDREQRQKLRTPEEINKEQKEQIAQTRSQLEQMAQQQRQWSQEVKPGAGNSKSESKSQKPSPSNSSGQASSSSQGQSPEQLAGQQQESLASAKELQDKMVQSENTLGAAEDRMEKATDSIEKSLIALSKNENQDAANRANQAADQLEEISKQLAALNAASFSDRLTHTQQLAQQLADQQSQLSKQMKQQSGDSPKANEGDNPSNGDSSNQGQTGGNGSTTAAQGGRGKNGQSNGQRQSELAKQQRQLASGADFLDELMAMLRGDTSGESGEIRDTLEDLSVTNPPGEISQTMRDAADDIDQGMASRAANSAGLATRSLTELANALNEARNRHAQPTLEELMKAEQDLADLMAAAKRARSTEEVAMLTEKANQSKARVSELAADDSALAKAANSDGAPSAAQSNSNTSQPGSANSATETGKNAQAGWKHSQQVLAADLRKLSKALQTSIQEAILTSTLKDADGAVPNNYKELVDEYYRALSDDLR